MKRFLKKLAAYALCLILPFALFFAYVQAKPAAYSASLMGATLYKYRLLEQTEGPKTVIVGGSSAPYAIVCADMEAAFGVPCIQLGTTAYLGIEFYLNELYGNLAQGDVVIITPEYGMLADAVSYSTLLMAIENRPALWRLLPLRYWTGVARCYFGYAKGKLAADLQPEDYDAVMAASAFGLHGDLTFERENILEQKYNTQDLWNVSAQLLDERVLAALNRFYAYAEKRGVAVYMSYAPFNRLALEGGMEGVEALQRRFERECPIPWLGTLAEGVMDEAYFYDSNNHLNSAGAALRTEALIEELRRALA